MPAWGVLTHVFGKMTTGKSTLVTDIVWPLRADSSRVAARVAQAYSDRWQIETSF